MISTGWIKLHRNIVNHWLWKDAERLKWWLELLLLVNYEDGQVLHDSHVINLKSGQMIASVSMLSERWKRDRKTILRFLKMLENEGMICRTVIHRQTPILTICNYDKYQVIEDTQRDTIEDTQRDTIEDTQRDTIEDTQRDTKKEIKELKNNIYTTTASTARTREGVDQEEEYYFDAYNNTQWREWVQMQTKITWEEMDGYFEEFRTFCTLHEKKHHSRADYQIHFVSWLKKQLAKENNQQETNKTFTHGNNRSKKCFSADEINIIVNAGLQGHNSQ